MATYIGDGNPDGVSFGTSATEKISFFGVTPVVQQAVGTTASDLATCITAITEIQTKMIAYGLTASA